MKRKILALALACLMLVSVLPTSVFAAEAQAKCPGIGEDHNKENCEYTMIDDVASVCGEIGYKLYECNTCKDHFADDLYREEGSHKWEDVPAKEATCTEPGWNAHKKCSVCGKKEGFKETLAGHDFGDVTCVKGGEATCLKCGKTQIMDDHLWSIIPEITDEPTLDKAGQAKYTCENCGEVKFVPIVKACTHPLTHHKAVAATCTKPGTIEYWSCEICNVNYNTNVAAKEFVVTDLTATVDHDWKSVKKVESTCAERGYEDFECKNCDATKRVDGPVVPHAPSDETAEIKPTCTTWGGYITLCTECGAVIKTDTVKPLGHKWPGVSTGADESTMPETTVLDGGDLALGKNLLTVTGMDGVSYYFTAPADGAYGFYISNEEYFAVGIDGIDYTEVVVELAEGDVYEIIVGSEASEGSWWNPTYVEDEITVIVRDASKDSSETPPTCTKPGERNYFCEQCQTRVVEVLEPTGHSGEDGKLETGYGDATCAYPAYYFYYCTNDNCDYGTYTTAYVEYDGEYYQVDVTIEVEVENDDPDAEPEYIRVPVHLARVDENGKESANGSLVIWDGEPSTEWYAHQWHDGDHEVTDKDGNIVPGVVINAPTHTTTGNAFGYCELCKEYVYAEEIPTIPYEWDDGVRVESTCNKTGYILYTCLCAYCKANELVTTKTEDLPEYEPQLQYTRLEAIAGHNLAKGLSYTQDAYQIFGTWGPRADADGYNYTLYRDGDCETVGLFRYYCLDCQQYILVVIDGTGNGHTEPTAEQYAEQQEIYVGYGPYKAPTCTEPGRTAFYKCTVCNKACGEDPGSYYVLEDGKEWWECEQAANMNLPALDHKHPNGDSAIIKYGEKKVTCTEDGYTAGEKCELCDYDVKPVKIEKLNHKHAVITDTWEANCTEFGYVHHECDCGYEWIDNYQYALGHLYGEPDYTYTDCEKGGVFGHYTCIRSKLCRYGEDKLIEEFEKKYHYNEAGEVLCDCTGDYEAIEDWFCVQCEQEIAPHREENLEVIVNPGNCLVDGVRIIFCNKCMQTIKTEELDSSILGKHDWDETNYAPSYAADGYRICKVCGKIETVDALKDGFNVMMDVDNNVAGVGFADSSLVKIVVSLKSLNKVNAHTVNFELKYDNKVVYFEGAKFLSENFVVNPLAVDNAKDGVVKVIASVNNDADKKAQNFEIADHDLVELYFRINNATATETSFVIDKVEALDKDVKAVNCAGSTASIKIQKFLDVDADGDFTLADVLTAYKMWNKELDRDYDVAIDVDKDGVITAADVLALYQYKVGALTYKQLIAMGVTSTAPEVKPEEKPSEPTEPTEPTEKTLVDVTELKLDTEYYIESKMGEGSIYFDGTLTKGRINGTLDYTTAVAVKLEAGEAAGEYYIYFISAEGVKTYIAAPGSKTSAFGFTTTKDETAVWIIDADAKTIISKYMGDRGIATQVGSTYYNYSTYAVSNLEKAEYDFAWLMELV